MLEREGWWLATHAACESAESLTLGTACHLRAIESEREERERGRRQESGEAHDRGHSE